jgi:hypothetical protein
MIPSPQGQRCVNASGHLNPDGKGMQETNMVLCTMNPDQYGLYHFILYQSLLPNAVAGQECATMSAILGTFQANTALINQNVATTMGPILAQMRQNWDAQEQALVKGNQRIAEGIRQTGANATARMNNIEAANDAQHRAFDATQEDHDRYTQGFSNYLLDQTVIRDVQDPNTHAMVWNRAAEFWQKAYPDRIEEVPTSQYIKGEDF